MLPGSDSYLHGTLLVQSFDSGDGGASGGKLDERAAFRSSVWVPHAVDLPHRQKQPQTKECSDEYFGTILTILYE